jgi:uncharacterized protein YbjT (DUF2867 family)
MTGCITVFGGTGFIGRHLVALLLQSGEMVRLAVRHPHRIKLATGATSSPAIVQADILDETSVGSAIVGADAVFNLVGILTETSTQTYHAIHVEGARRVALAAQRHGVMRLIHISALGASLTSPAISDRTKAEGEEAVRAAFPQATIVRPSLAYGEDDHFFSRFAAMIRSSPVLPVIGAGTTKFQPVFVDDMTAGTIGTSQALRYCWQDLRVWGTSGLLLQSAPETLADCAEPAAGPNPDSVCTGRNAGGAT